MAKLSRSALIAAATAAALPLLWSVQTASAQYRLDTGHANDANNRIGSGGYNDAHDLSQPSMGASNDQVITGNVTGLAGFHGNAQSFDANVLQTGTQSLPSDILNQQAGPVNYSQRTTGQAAYQPFYSTAVITQPPPPDTLSLSSNNVGYTSAPPQTQLPSDTRLGTINQLPSAALNPAPGELDLPGPVDTSGNPMLTTMSPLYGARDWSVGNANDMYFLSRYSNLGGPNAGLDAGQIQQMRNELSASVVQGSSLAQQDQSGGMNNLTTSANNSGNTNSNSANGPAPQQNGPNATGSNNKNGAGANASGSSNNLAQSQQLNQSAVTPGGVALSQQALSASLNAPSISSGLNTGEGSRQQLLDAQLPAPGQQSSLLATLEDRERALQAQSHQPMTDEEATRLYNQEHSLRNKIAQQSNAGNGITPSAPGGSSVAPPSGGYGAPAPAANPPMAGLTTPPPANNKLNPMLTAPQPQAGAKGAAMEPMVITSLATGIRAPGLAKLMSTAEDQMRAGKFNNALDTYDSAQQVAPNNPFIHLGRGFAELGASYYGRAERDIRQSVAADPAVLAGRYDLKGFLGEDRLNFVTKDLNDIYKSETSSASSAFLLAFLAHNAAQDDQAAAYLDAVEKREGHADSIVAQMRRNWGLPTAAK